jgi:hypothetical protein
MMGIRMTNTERSGSPVADPEISELVEDLAVIEVKKGATFAFPEFLPRHWIGCGHGPSGGYWKVGAQPFPIQGDGRTTWRKPILPPLRRADSISPLPGQTYLVGQHSGGMPPPA